MASLCEAGHDTLVGSKVMVVMAGLEWLHQDDVSVDVVGEHDVVVAASGADWKAAQVISVELADRFGVDE